MKILYIKNNSDRTKKFQLKTIIYEEDRQKFVKKQALCPEAIPHLKTMKEHYASLTDSVLDPRIRLAKIINESDDSLTFEFIEGISFEKKFSVASKQNKEALNELIDTYMAILKTGLKTTRFESAAMVTKTHRELFGDIDYSIFDGEVCFEGISNLDLIFSNIIFKDESIYLIDYEWVFGVDLPIVYSLFRALTYSSSTNQKESVPIQLLSSLHSVEDHFLKNIETKESFATIKDRYMKHRFPVSEHTQKNEQAFLDKEREIKYWQDTAQSMRLKNRFLRILKIFTSK